MNIGEIIALINLVVVIFVVIFGFIAAKKLKNAAMSWAAIFLLLTGVLFVVHAFIEVLGFGEGLYALSAIIATLFLGFSLVLFDVNISAMLR